MAECARVSWKKLRHRVLMRAHERCEQCRAPNRQIIAIGIGPREGTYMVEDGDVFNRETGKLVERARGSEYEAGDFLAVVLIVVFLDHDRTNFNEANLRALCSLHAAKHNAGDVTRSRKDPRRRHRAAKEFFE